jgi:hypothetical protein
MKLITLPLIFYSGPRRMRLLMSARISDSSPRFAGAPACLSADARSKPDRESARGINGMGGFAAQTAVNFAAALHARLRSGDLYLNFGSPSASTTLDRLIFKYVFRAGADDGA